MKINIESTTQIVSVMPAGHEMLARVWEGKTETGIAVQVLVVRISAPKDADLAQFERELEEKAAPTLAERAFPLRMII